MTPERKRMIKVEFGVYQFCRAKECHFKLEELQPICQQCRSLDRFVVYQKEIGAMTIDEIPIEKLAKIIKEGWLSPEELTPEKLEFVKKEIIRINSERK